MKSTTTRSLAAISAALVAVNVAVFGQVRDFEFVDLDDISMIVENDHVRHGLNRESIAAAFAIRELVLAEEGSADHWRPVATLSLLLDVSLFGLENPGAFHLVNLGFHIASTLLLLFVLHRLTGAVWKSGIVAALFAVHPLHVESVAWVFERKDVLAAFFWFLTMFAWERYARRGGIGRYLLVVLCLMLSLMSKPLAVTLPFALLLLDFWPLRRWRRFADPESPAHAPPPAREGPGTAAGPARCRPRSLGFLLLEKAPLLACSAIFSAIVMASHSSKGALVALDAIPFGERLAFALRNYGMYLWKTVWPRNLAVLYQHPLVLRQDPMSELLWPAIASAVVLSAITAFAFLRVRRQPFVAVGWLWFLGTLAPMIGLVQAGAQETADRFTYVPHVGLFLAVVWLADDLVCSARRIETRRNLRWAAGLAAGAAIVLSAAAAWQQTKVWRNTETLYGHLFAVSEGQNVMALRALAQLALERNDPDRAILHALKAQEIEPRKGETALCLGIACLMKGNPHAAIDHFRLAREFGLQERMSYQSLELNLGIALAQTGRHDEAAEILRAARESNPRSATVRIALGEVYVQQQQWDRAEALFRESLGLEPESVPGLNGLGRLLLDRGRPADAAPLLRRAAAIAPEDFEARYRLALALSATGALDEAEAHFVAALGIRPASSAAHAGYGRLLLRAGRHDEAARHIDAAAQIDPSHRPSAEEARNVSG